MKHVVKAECNSCDGTGLYQGMCEPEGVAVVCLGCKGTGCEEIAYKPFKKRKPKRGVKRVYLSPSRMILAAGPRGDGITYAEFSKGKMPTV